MRVWTKKWTEEEKETFGKLYPTNSDADVAAALGRTVESVKSKARVLGLTKDKAFNGAMTEEQKEALIALYPNTKNKVLAEMFGISENSLVLRAYRMGLKKSRAHLSAISKEAQEKGGFRRNHQAWNKGMKGLKIGGKVTQFKTNHVPYNRKPVGTVALRFDRDSRCYLAISVAVGKWIPLSHHIFKEYYGEIPKGMVIRFRNGNRLDVRLENLECMSRREHAIRNGGTVELSDSFVLKTLAWRDKGLKQKIKEEVPELINVKREILKLKKECKTT